MPADPPQPDPTPATEKQMRRVSVGGLSFLKGPVEVVPYDPRWPETYELEAARLRSVLGDRVLALAHVGSTAVPELLAKPIIDVDLTVADAADEDAYVPALQDAGYRLKIREPDWHEHRMLKGPGRNVNLHVWSPGCPEVERHLLFRDWLRANEDDRRRYGELKRDLATRDFRFTYEYNNAKAPLIHEILARALRARSGTAGG